LLVEELVELMVEVAEVLVVIVLALVFQFLLAL
jgi:hypothetical protein